MFKPLLISLTVLVLGCKNTPLSSCVLMNEMGSKKSPFRIAFVSENGSASELNLVQTERSSFADLRSCLEREAGISVQFDAVESEPSLLGGLESNNYQFAVVNSLSYGISQNFQFARTVVEVYHFRAFGTLENKFRNF
jgi:hypothetical protein